MQGCTHVSTFVPFTCLCHCVQPCHDIDSLKVNEACGALLVDALGTGGMERVTLHF